LDEDLIIPESVEGTAERLFVPPSSGEQITGEVTGNTYEMGERIGEGHFAIAFRCKDVWGNSLAAKVLKPRGTYEVVRAAETEFVKLLHLRHPNV
jgi:hypothetical protein